jgi:hypothetical protein
LAIGEVTLYLFQFLLKGQVSWGAFGGHCRMMATLLAEPGTFSFIEQTFGELHITLIDIRFFNASILDDSLLVVNGE